MGACGRPRTLHLLGAALLILVWPRAQIPPQRAGKPQPLWLLDLRSFGYVEAAKRPAGFRWGAFSLGFLDEQTLAVGFTLAAGSGHAFRREASPDGARTRVLLLEATTGQVQQRKDLAYGHFLPVGESKLLLWELGRGVTLYSASLEPLRQRESLCAPAARHCRLRLSPSGRSLFLVSDSDKTCIELLDPESLETQEAWSAEKPPNMSLSYIAVEGFADRALAGVDEQGVRLRQGDGLWHTIHRRDTRCRSFDDTTSFLNDSTLVVANSDFESTHSDGDCSPKLLVLATDGTVLQREGFRRNEAVVQVVPARSGRRFVALIKKGEWGLPALHINYSRWRFRLIVYDLDLRRSLGTLEAGRVGWAISSRGSAVIEGLEPYDLEVALSPAGRLVAVAANGRLGIYSLPEPTQASLTQAAKPR